MLKTKVVAFSDCLYSNLNYNLITNKVVALFQAVVGNGMRRPSARVSQQSFDEAALRRMSLQESKASEDIRNANADEQVRSFLQV